MEQYTLIANSRWDCTMDSNIIRKLYKDHETNKRVKIASVLIT